MSYFETQDKTFSDYIIPVCDLEILADGLAWGEGPVWFGDNRALLFSDIPKDRMLKWDETSGQVSLFRSPSNFANGNTRDREGRLLTCEHGGRRVTRTEYDGSITVLADNFQGRRLNSPNDVVVTSDGAIWFTDPPYGILTDYEGHKAESELDGCHVFRLDPITGDLAIVADDFVKPNGLAFSADETALFVADSGRSHDQDAPHHIRKFQVNRNGTLSGGAIFTEIDPGVPDGLRIDERGNLWVAAGDGVHCYGQDGRLLGKILTGEVVANLCFGGAKRNRLFITGKSKLQSVYLNTIGIQRP
ncbi:SMP-30/gluconolactonase/LRE family protein [Acidisoma cellulosilytica]|uniref:SMP-30/gluconolactonase/LRE family protein n=1 Tax=Acidisoma cellulosilyticum TaxID=2802395 RepID=A0A964E525_9PROT|nr:SMP-30/gluconolactonase/LRE family protein [Acidisoma cellulosilyticum]MCB8882255.1 SMP-30/gluconolactonase/LRE family protein [Acidisoma cellulosilyticum]